MNPCYFFPLGIPHRLCISHQPTCWLGVASGNWSWCRRDHMWHVTWHSWQLCGLFTVSPQGQRISYWTCVHMKTTCIQTLHESERSFMYHMHLYHGELQIHCTSNLLCVFSEYSVVGCTTLLVYWSLEFLKLSSETRGYRGIMGSSMKTREVLQ